MKVDKSEVTIDDSMFYRPPLDESDIGVENRWIELIAIYQYPESNQVSLPIQKSEVCDFRPTGQSLQPMNLLHTYRISKIIMRKKTSLRTYIQNEKASIRQREKQQQLHTTVIHL